MLDRKAKPRSYLSLNSSYHRLRADKNRKNIPYFLPVYSNKKIELGFPLPDNNQRRTRGTMSESDFAPQEIKENMQT
ncbi:MAG: hypothetical protein IJI25_02335 [Eubacterium sp.]|nr:hypothetical protein [Eubacterium sp.]